MADSVPPELRESLEQFRSTAQQDEAARAELRAAHLGHEEARKKSLRKALSWAPAIAKVALETRVPTDIKIVKTHSERHRFRRPDVYRDDRGVGWKLGTREIVHDHSGSTRDLVPSSSVQQNGILLTSGGVVAAFKIPRMDGEIPTIVDEAPPGIVMRDGMGNSNISYLDANTYPLPNLVEHLGSPIEDKDTTAGIKFIEQSLLRFIDTYNLPI